MVIDRLTLRASIYFDRLPKGEKLDINSKDVNSEWHQMLLAHLDLGP